mmetsp:Transcript_17668/g.50857  ORF Transcript_17668/g.50857 Transcript_17668/m.50857 type:complete len:255 (-) Transcript_17668:2-766(-)
MTMGVLRCLAPYLTGRSSNFAASSSICARKAAISSASSTSVSKAERLARRCMVLPCSTLTALGTLRKCGSEAMDFSSGGASEPSVVVANSSTGLAKCWLCTTRSPAGGSGAAGVAVRGSSVNFEPGQPKAVSCCSQAPGWKRKRRFSPSSQQKPSPLIWRSMTYLNSSAPTASGTFNLTLHTGYDFSSVVILRPDCGSQLPKAWWLPTTSTASPGTVAAEPSLNVISHELLSMLGDEGCSTTADYKVIARWNPA